VLIVRLRQAVIGDQIKAETLCRAPDCGQRIDISFGLAEYLKQHQPAKADLRGGWSLEASGEPGWFRLYRRSEGSRQIDPDLERRDQEEQSVGAPASSASEIHFRLPTAEDQLAIAGRPEAEEELARRCLRPATGRRDLRRRAEAAMEALAPSLCSELRGVCPHCGSQVAVYFEARAFCLRELRARAALSYEDIDIVARRYHWSEQEILALPQSRRASYAEFARQEEGL
jgi:hypothetical protein